MSLSSSLDEILNEWRVKHPNLSFPNFDPQSTDKPHTLILLESPGPEVENSKIISMANNDATARELYRLAKLAFGEGARSQVLLWNAIPWFLKKDEKIKSGHLGKAKLLHFQLIKVVEPYIRNVVFLGRPSRDLLPFYSGVLKSCRFFGGHHTGMKAQKSLLIKENEAVFLNIKTSAAAKSECNI
ncbi:uracil-DNA glycosylase family protein [Azotobacter chroococcum]|uniref:hypothetical protein n=1 Tax=Azotobacter chroococcum TaxID=353 RepID=UPI0012FDE2FB|nr:hypothetical protein [Azotobacter chroococcum]